MTLTELIEQRPIKDDLCNHSQNYIQLKKQEIMLRWTITFVIIAIVAAILGFGGIAGASAGIAKILFFIFIVLFILSLIRGGFRR